MLTLEDWIFVGIPIMLAVGGAAVTFFPPQSRKAKTIWIVGFAGLGIVYVIVALVQIRAARKDEADAKISQRQSTAKIDALSSQLKQLSQKGLEEIFQQALGQQQRQQPQITSAPDLALVFSDPSSVVVTVLNRSKVVANGPAYFVALWDLDSAPGLLSQPLQIPAQRGDFVRAGEGWGPNMMMGIQAVSGRVKTGDRIFGFASVTCPTCKLRRYYWLYIKQGSEGWYSESKPIDIQDLGRSIPSIAQEPDSTLSKLVPIRRRIPIESLK